MTDTRQALAARYTALLDELAGNWEVMAEMESGSQAGRRETLRECADGLRMLADIIGRAALSAQPVAGAVATEPSEEIQELRAQVEAWRKQCETLTHQVICCGVAARHPDATLTTRGAYAGKWNSPQAEEVRKLRAERDALLAASPHPEPSAQGEPVAGVTEEMVTAYLTANDAYWKRIDGEPTKLGKWRNGTPSEATRLSLMAALASAPSTPPPAMVGAVPMESWPIERAADMLTAYAEMVKATGRYAEKHYIPEIENVAAELRGIAPKAAQEKTCEHVWKVTQQGQTYMDCKCEKCGETKRQTWD